MISILEMCWSAVWRYGIKDVLQPKTQALLWDNFRQSENLQWEIWAVTSTKQLRSNLISIYFIVCAKFRSKQNMWKNINAITMKTHFVRYDALPLFQGSWKFHDFSVFSFFFVCLLKEQKQRPRASMTIILCLNTW